MKIINTLKSIMDSILRGAIVALLVINLLAVKTLIIQQKSETIQLEMLGQTLYYNQENQLQIIKNLIENDYALTKVMFEGRESILNLIRSIIEVDKNQTLKLQEPNYELITKANIEIENWDKNIVGSGVCITYEGKEYILSVFHLDETKEIYANDGGRFVKLELILSDQSNDLVLFKATKELNTVRYIPFVGGENYIGEKVWVCGNPSGLTDAITSGIIIKKMKRKYLVDASIYFGNSGGGVFNRDTKLVGIASMIAYNIDYKTLLTMSYGVIIDVNVIEEFLGQLQ